MIKILRVFTTFSIIVFLAVLLVVYAFLPDPAGIVFTDKGNVIYEISRNTFFYMFAGGFLLFQLTFFLFNTLVSKNRFKTAGRYGLAAWFRGMFLAVNIFFILLILFYGFANNAISYSYSSVLFMGIAGPVILVIWLLLFPVFYYKVFPEE
ncbi:MAG: hypothetical protein KFF73_03305 [Cyclobacteriaceae bacterium]|nr:hypothetical protein [Cyclobacteriaceae bacterium]